MKAISMKDLKYAAPYLLPLLCVTGCLYGGVFTWATPLLVFVILPLVEHFLPLDKSNLSEDLESPYTRKSIFDWLLYLNIPLVYLTYFLVAWTISQFQHHPIAFIGLVFSLGIVLGTNGINVAHELGHRPSYADKIAAFLLLLPSYYTHFTIEHNLGHHKYVATPVDPATAKKGQNIYNFWIQSMVGTYLNAWKWQISLLKKNNSPFFSFTNKLLWNHFIQIGFGISIYLLFGFKAFFACLLGALISILLLESINYIEHYGLYRISKDGRIFEPVSPKHSWNSDHRMGRIFLFELTRHSDHHYKSTRKYQILRHLEPSPQLPTGYPGSIILSLIPSLWFKIMDREIVYFKQHLEELKTES